MPTRPKPTGAGVRVEPDELSVLMSTYRTTGTPKVSCSTPTISGCHALLTAGELGGCRRNQSDTAHGSAVPLRLPTFHSFFLTTS